MTAPINCHLNFAPWFYELRVPVIQVRGLGTKGRVYLLIMRGRWYCISFQVDTDMAQSAIKNFPNQGGPSSLVHYADGPTPR